MKNRLYTLSLCTDFIMASTTVLIHLPLGLAPAIYSLNHLDPYITIPVFCKLRTYLIQFTLMLYRWCLVAACFDRYTLTSPDVRLRNLAKVHIAYRVILIMTIIWMSLPIHILIFFNTNGVTCFSLGSIVVSIYHSIYTLITGSVLPVSIMSVCALLVRRNLVHKSQIRQQLTVNQQNNNEHTEHKRDQQIFMMLLIQALVYVITQTPWMLFNIYTTATIYVTNKSRDRIAIEQFIRFIADMIIFLHPVLSFYLYTLTSHTFRGELIKLLCHSVKCRQGNHSNRVIPLTNNAS